MEITRNTSELVSWWLVTLPKRQILLWAGPLFIAWHQAPRWLYRFVRNHTA